MPQPKYELSKLDFEIIDKALSFVAVWDNLSSNDFRRAKELRQKFDDAFTGFLEME